MYKLLVYTTNIGMCEQNEHLSNVKVTYFHNNLFYLPLRMLETKTVVTLG